ncbi:HNH endonuclease [Geodermatophilus dictyosporus]|uniref:HNH endonuclease n=1 Tax=Geodermatophilus dictyosporus TaxID=1523247 RepID=A0A1I5SJ38_9ACTN|nr:HNH endonuclease signature motif containing protein [Geodermatophilus dictyosporus]SFP70713.1 HNH endonuclease [Geodermatophilus dictyosporus]
MEQLGEDQPPVAGGLLGLLVAEPPELRRLPVALLTRGQKAAELEHVAALKARLAAYEAELVLGLADDSPDDLDPTPGTPGAKRGSWAPDAELPGVSEFFTAELAMVLNCGRRSASLLAQRAWVFRESLPGTWAALAEGVLDEARAKVLVDVLQHTDPYVARQVESRLLPEAAGWTTHTLRKRAVAALLAVDADAVDARRKEAERQADVRVYPSPREGMSSLTADLPAPVAAACFDLVDRLAVLMKKDDDERPIGQLRAAVLADLIQRPWDDTRPPVTAHLQLIATLGALTGESSQAGEVNGLPITIGQLRDLLARLEALGLRTPEGGSVTLALTDDDGALWATTTLDRLRRLAKRGCPTHPAADCGCAVLDRPAEVDTYEPSTAQQTFVHTRDRTCRFPGCGQRVGWADADHVIAHAHGGATDCANLCCLCRSHHRLKTFAPGWRFQMSPDGVLTVTTPSGITRTTRPPGTRPPPAEHSAPPPGEPDHDPPPF